MHLPPSWILRVLVHFRDKLQNPFQKVQIVKKVNLQPTVKGQ